MNERRRAPRIPLHIPVELKRISWDRHQSLDVSHRGLSLRLITPFLPGQLIQVRVLLPGEKAPIEMLGKLARQDTPIAALTTSRPPIAGIEFFCLSGVARKSWVEFIWQAQKGLEPLTEASGPCGSLEGNPPTGSARH